MNSGNIKAIAIDLDGTLLNKQNEVSDRNRRAVARARELGLLVIPCTGRLYCESKFAIDAIDGCEYSLHCNGSAVLNHKTGSPVSLNTLSPELADRAIAQLDSYNVLYQIYVDDADCCAKRFYKDFDERIFNAVYARMFRDTQLWMDDPRSEIAAQGLRVFKFYIPNKDHDLLERIKNEMKAIPGLDATFSSMYSLEVFMAGMDKENGLARLLEHLGLTFENLMMIGDSENDLKAIRAAGIGVAMGNALDFIKEGADFVTLDRGESGVAHAIEQIIFKPAGITL